MELSRYEQETIINFNEADSTASVYTHNKALLRKLDKLAQDRPGDCHREKASHDGKAVDFIISKSWVRITPSRQLSDAEKAQRREAVKKANLARKSTGRPQE